MKRSVPSGKYTITGPFEPDHPAPTVGAGIVGAQTFCTRHRRKAEDLTYYVRTLTGEVVAKVWTENGVTLTLEGRL